MINDSVYIVMPAYNEQDAILDVLCEWYPKVQDKVDGSALVIADSGSTDKTHEIILNFKENHPHIIVLSDTAQYHGPKVISLYKKAIEDGIEYVFQTDSDGQTVAEDFDKFWELRNDYDAIIGHRKNRGDGAFRAFVEKSCCILIRFYLHISVKDSNAPFRLIKCDALSEFANLIPEDHVLPNILVTLYLKMLNKKVCFIPIKFLTRESGNSMYDLKKIINYGLNTLKDFHRLKKWSKKIDANKEF